MCLNSCDRWGDQDKSQKSSSISQEMVNKVGGSFSEKHELPTGSAEPQTRDVKKNVGRLQLLFSFTKCSPHTCAGNRELFRKEGFLSPESHQALQPLECPIFSVPLQNLSNFQSHLQMDPLTRVPRLFLATLLNASLSLSCVHIRTLLAQGCRPKM